MLTIFSLTPDRIIDQMWSNGVQGGKTLTLLHLDPPSLLPVPLPSKWKCTYEYFHYTKDAAQKNNDNNVIAISEQNYSKKFYRWIFTKFLTRWSHLVKKLLIRFWVIMYVDLNVNLNVDHNTTNPVFMFYHHQPLLILTWWWRHQTPLSMFKPSLLAKHRYYRDI